MRLKGIRAKTIGLIAGLVATGFLTPSCEQGGAQGQVGSGGTNPGLTSTTNSGPSFGTVTTGSTSDTIQAFKNAQGVKVVFNKSSFFTNQTPGPSACAGDARYYYDPLSDRKVPVKPSWLKNVAVDITNSNAPNGPSRATGCSLTGLGTADSSNCASFDDLQPLDGTKSRAVLIGGYGCKTGTTACSATHVLSDIWNIVTTDLSTGNTWTPQSTGLPILNGINTLPGLVWHAGDFDEIHNHFYIFGGASPNVNVTNSTVTFSNKVIRVTFNSDGTVSTSPQPEIATPNSNRYYAGWAKAGAFNAALAPYIPPPAVVGPTFTYGIRRDPSMKSSCRFGDAFGTWTCLASGTVVPNKRVGANEHQDYYLLLGGMNIGGMFSKDIYAYKPHGYSPEATTVANADGDWTVLSNIIGQPSLSSKVMTIVDLSTSTDVGTTIAPIVVTDVGSARPTGDVFSGWVGRAFHKTVYDPAMNRFFIFGGLQNRGVLSGVPISASTTAPDLASNDLWVYDPPSLGRRPTVACFTNLTPDNVSLPSANVVGATSNLDANREYLASNFVFPPGGCLQRIVFPTAPEARFEHAMAFDRDTKAMMVFGGCKTPAVIRPPANSQGGDPTLNCNSAGSLLDDTWVYLPPTTTEYVSKDYRAPASKTSPYNALSLLANVFGTDFWLDRAPIFDDNQVSNGTLTMPRLDQLLGTWVRLTPTIKPPPRVGASLVYDRAHRKYLLQGGFGCSDSQCSTPPKALNDLWAFTPPDFNDPAQCSRENATCESTVQGVWTKLRADKDDSNSEQPTQRRGALIAYANSSFSTGDEFYSVRDSSCIAQGPIASTDSSVSKRLVGAIYVDVDRSVLGVHDNLLINLRFLPYDKNTRAPGFFDNNTPTITVDDTDRSGAQDQALIRVQLLNSGLKFAEQIQATIQPRYHEFISGTPILGDTFAYVSGGSGQVTEKQILIPLSIDPTINLIKIERVEGTVKFFEMTVSKF